MSSKSKKKSQKSRSFPEKTYFWAIKDIYPYAQKPSITKISSPVSHWKTKIPALF